MAPISPIDGLPWPLTNPSIPTDQPNPVDIAARENTPAFTQRDSDEVGGWDSLGGAIAGIVVGSLVGAGLIGFLIHCLWKRRASRKARHHEARSAHKQLESPDVETPPVAAVANH